MLTRSRTRLKRPRGFISEISHPHEGVTRNDLDCQSSINDDKSTLSTMPSMMGPSSQDTAHLLLHSEKNVQEIVRLFEKEDEEIRHLNDDIKKQQKKLNTLEAHKRRRIEDFRAQLREEKMRLFRERLQNVEDLHQRLKDLQQLASDLELSAIQECPVCYEVCFALLCFPLLLLLHLFGVSSSPPPPSHSRTPRSSSWPRLPMAVAVRQCWASSSTPSCHER